VGAPVACRLGEEGPGNNLGFVAAHQGFDSHRHNSATTKSMKPKTDTQDILLDIDDINETVLQTAATIDPEIAVENEQTISEQLVSAGNEEADLEQRVASNISKQSTKE
jgi:hypothetical protein